MGSRLRCVIDASVVIDLQNGGILLTHTHTVASKRVESPNRPVKDLSCMFLHALPVLLRAEDVEDRSGFTGIGEGRVMLELLDLPIPHLDQEREFFLFCKNGRGFKE